MTLDPETRARWEEDARADDAERRLGGVLCRCGSFAVLPGEKRIEGGSWAVSWQHTPARCSIIGVRRRGYDGADAGEGG